MHETVDHGRPRARQGGRGAGRRPRQGEGRPGRARSGPRGLPDRGRRRPGHRAAAAPTGAATSARCVHRRCTALPETPHEPAVAAAKAAGDAARKRSDAAERVVAEQDKVARDLDRGLAAARAHAEQVDARLSTLDAALDGAPAPEALRRDLDAIAKLHRGLDEAGGAEVRKAREAHRKAAGAAPTPGRGPAAGGVEGVRRGRDALAAFGPPPADRDDLAEAWATLTGWAGTAAGERQARRAGRRRGGPGGRDAASARGQRATCGALFAAAGLPAPGADPAREAAVALERAEAAHRRLEERRAEAARLREHRAEVAKESQVAKALARHLRADHFERWLLAEALDMLVDGASRILRELSGGQYDLVHDKGEFFVVDHHDAGLRRAVRTLSGGETFQASLALALALSEQLAGLSTTAASLESIVLDEGFGTLDASTLDTVAATLENLAARGDRMVGVVTHVRRARRTHPGPVRGAPGRPDRPRASGSGCEVPRRRLGPLLRGRASSAADGPQAQSSAQIQPDVELPAKAWRADRRRPPGCGRPPWSWSSTGSTASTPGSGRPTTTASPHPGVAASYAAGVVRCDLDRGAAAHRPHPHRARPVHPLRARSATRRRRRSATRPTGSPRGEPKDLALGGAAAHAGARGRRVRRGPRRRRPARGRRSAAGAGAPAPRARLHQDPPGRVPRRRS